MEVFVERLNETLKNSNITPYKLSKDLKISKSLVHYWCSGKVLPSVLYLKQICEYLDVSADYLLGLSEF